MSESYEETSQSQMQSILDRQRAAYLAEGVVSSETRMDRLERAVQVVKKHQNAFSSKIPHWSLSKFILLVCNRC